MTAKRKRVKILSILLVAVFLAGSLLGCSGKNPPAAATNTATPSNSAAGGPKFSGAIEVGVMPAEGTAAHTHLRGVADKLIAENPGISIEYTFANTKARPFMEQRWRAGDAPDIDYFVFNAQVPKTHEFIDKLLDLTPYLGKDGWGDTFLDSAKTVTSINGGTYGVITDTHVISLFYNEKMFKDLDIAPPTNWDELMAAGRKLKENGIDPIAVTGLFQPYMGFWIDYLLQREVGYDEAKAAITSGNLKGDPGFLNAAKKVEQMVTEGFFLNGFEGTDFTAAQIQFFQGKAGMILMGTWLSSEMKDSIPADFELGVVSFPTVPGGKGAQDGIMCHSNIMSVNKATKNIDLVIEYLKRVTSVEVQTERSKQLSLISAVKDVPAPVGTTGLNEMVQNAGDMYVRWYGLEYEPDKNNAYYNEVAKLFFGEYTAEEFINAVDNAMSKLAN